jgi:catechol 2,3-dioxygenase-like lactoylglutathione lyase family enzyme
MAITKPNRATKIYSDDPGRLSEWYRRVLGVETSRDGEDPNYYGSVAPRGGPGAAASPEFHVGFYPSNPDRPPNRIMINYEIDDFDGLLEALGAMGVAVEGPVAKAGRGKFAYVRDPDGNPIELWSGEQQAGGPEG